MPVAFAAAVTLVLLAVAPARAQDRAEGLDAPTPGRIRQEPASTRTLPPVGAGTGACWDASDFPDGAAPPDAERTRCRRNWVEMMELYAWSGIFGLAAGGWIAARLGIEADGLGVLFGGLGVAGTTLGVRLFDSAFDGLSPGVPSAMWTGILLGTFEGFFAWSAFGNDMFTGAWSGTFYLSSAAIGLAVGTAVGVALRPTAGDAALLRTGAVWGTWLAQMLNLTFGVADDPVDTFRTLFTGFNAGIVGAAILSAVWRTTRARLLWLDLGAVAGAIVGAALVSPDTASDRAIGAVVGLGTVAGMAVSVWLTAEKDPEPEGPAPVTAWGGPVEGGAMVGTTTRF